jgi:hypothetical protein
MRLFAVHWGADRPDSSRQKQSGQVGALGLLSDEVGRALGRQACPHYWPSAPSWGAEGVKKLDWRSVAALGACPAMAGSAEMIDSEMRRS